MPDTTLNEAVKEAYASCPTNVITYETLQIHHSTLPGEDIWIVKNRENLTLGLEPGAIGTSCGLNPGDPGPAPPNPSDPGDPGSEPTDGDYEPVIGYYVYLACNSGDEVERSFEPFDRYAYGSAYETWVTQYNLWWPTYKYDNERRQNAVDAAIAAYISDHARWVVLQAAHAAWVVAKAAYDAYVIAHQIYLNWLQSVIDLETWNDCVEAETVNQEFIGLAFELTRSASGEGGIQELSFSACDVDRVISDWLSSVSETGSLEPIEVTYRIYVSTDLTAPAIDPPLKLYLTDAKVDTYTVSARASFADLVNRPFPNVYYKRSKFPSLGN